MSKKMQTQNKRELILYLFFGVLTTLVCVTVFQGLEWLLRPRIGDHSYLLSNVASFIAGTMFAFIANKIYVFQQKNWAIRVVAREAASFTAARLFSFGLEYLLTFLFFDFGWPKIKLSFVPLWEKYGVFLAPETAYRFLVRWGCIATLGVVLNYIFSKYFIFKKQPPEEEAA